jgi:hypothetical protein
VRAGELGDGLACDTLYYAEMTQKQLVVTISQACGVTGTPATGRRPREPFIVLLVLLPWLHHAAYAISFAVRLRSSSTH